MYVSVRSDSSGISELAQGTSFARQAVVSFVDVVDSAVVLDRVIDDLNLDMTAQQLAGSIQASSPTNSVIITIKATAADADKAASIANSVGTNFSDVVVNRLEKPEGETASLVRVETIAPALVPTSPSSPHTPINVALGLIVGLAAGLGIAVLRSVLDTRIHSLHDIEAATEAPVLGGIALDPDAKKRPLIVHADPRNPGQSLSGAFGRTSSSSTSTVPRGPSSSPARAPVRVNPQRRRTSPLRSRRPAPAWRSSTGSASTSRG